MSCSCCCVNLRRASATKGSSTPASRAMVACTCCSRLRCSPKGSGALAEGAAALVDNDAVLGAAEVPCSLAASALRSAEKVCAAGARDVVADGDFDLSLCLELLLGAGDSDDCRGGPPPGRIGRATEHLKHSILPAKLS